MKKFDCAEIGAITLARAGSFEGIPGITPGIRATELGVPVGTLVYPIDAGNPPTMEESGAGCRITHGAMRHFMVGKPTEECLLVRAVLGVDDMLSTTATAHLRSRIGKIRVFLLSLEEGMKLRILRGVEGYQLNVENGSWSVEEISAPEFVLRSVNDAQEMISDVDKMGQSTHESRRGAHRMTVGQMAELAATFRGQVELQEIVAKYFFAPIDSYHHEKVTRPVLRKIAPAFLGLVERTRSETIREDAAVA